jgi:hypothetical protein
VVVAKGVILLLYFDVGFAVSSVFNGIKKNCCSFFQGVCCVHRVDESAEESEGASSVMK